MARRTLGGLVIILLVLAVMVAALYLNRRAAAREALTGWLERKGIDADVEVDRLEVDGFVGKITIGDPRDPDFKVERVEVDYALGMPWSKAGLGVTPSRVRLIRPVARASWKDGTLSLGSLDPLIKEFTTRPPQPDSRAPLIIIEKARARIDSEYGPVQVLADARIDNSRLIQLNASLPSGSLKSGDTEVRDVSAVLALTTSGDRVAVKFDASADSFAAKGLGSEGLGGERVRLSMMGDLPYPDLESRKGDGRATIDVKMLADSLTGSGSRAKNADVTINFDGAVKGWIESFSLDGRGSTLIRADQISTASGAVRDAQVQMQRAEIMLARGEEFKWRVTSPATVRMASANLGATRLQAANFTSAELRAGGQNGVFEVRGPVSVTAGQLRSGDLTLSDARGQVALDIVRDGVTVFDLKGSLASPHAGWTGLGPVKAGDLPEVAELKRGLANLAFTAPGLAVSVSNDGTEVSLTQAATARPANGGLLTLTAGKTPLFAAQPGESGGGTLQITSRRGGGLPEAEIAVPSWKLGHDGFEAALDGKAKLDFGPGREIALSAKGLLASHSGTMTFASTECVPITVDRLELGENDVTDVSGRLCPNRNPLITVRNGTWRATGTLADVSATAPFLAMRIADGQGNLVVDGQASGLSMTADVHSASVADTTMSARFLPLTATGQATLSSDVWSAGFDLQRTGHAIARVDLRHDGRAEAGGVAIIAPSLIFTEHGLQPDDLSPLAADFVQSPVEGSAGFEGQFDWTPTTSTSSGVLTTPGLDFTSPAGKVEGLKGRVEFTSLTPLISAPDQKLTADKVVTVVPLSDLEILFSLTEETLKLASGKIAAANGQISIEPFEFPLTPGAGWGGVIVVEQIQLNELMKSANLQEKAMLDAVVSGRLPFTYSADKGWQVTGGVLTAVRPGRLSIQPEVFDDLGAGAGENSAGLPPNTMQDLAYQALQDLAISDLTAEVNSLDEGRLGVRFRINGRHDPPQREQLRLTFMELIRRDFMNKKLNLPSDTPIDLTLDTTWNANQIASDLLDYARRGETP